MDELNKGSINKKIEGEFALNSQADDEQFITKQMSFKSNRSMWENKTLDRPIKKTLTNPRTAPDLLQDLLTSEKSKAMPSGVRSRSSSNISAGRMSPGQDVPDGIVLPPQKPVGTVKPMTQDIPKELIDEKKEDIMDITV